MENPQSMPERSLSNLKVADLELLIAKIVKKVIKEETQQQQLLQSANSSQDFSETFGSWEDTRSTEEIIDDIYASRTVGEM
ncbi:MAG: hypothetical protein KME60_20390 [Cyanomargarita calcarea GSE-NOS-MK-12-04C]|jgi:DNA-directed RNA polymerase subunit F|uniref:Uncharacterized protein n=1 Tax=Cyanomargarita calcarea GSE-NOS-MK-12-04C TaxID=2839659 RepID=A0A951QQC9_9CYAN|nr:hypothetical protein [Cyanomargarita calcarea GSE-NOS-MK-12-04C]